VIFPTPVPVGVATITLGTGEVANSRTFNDAYTLLGGDLTLSAGLDRTAVRSTSPRPSPRRSTRS
jgi:hypothetical protein